MQIQAYLTAAAINLKRLATWIIALPCVLLAGATSTMGKRN
jgi:hypothetical protein